MAKSLNELKESLHYETLMYKGMKRSQRESKRGEERLAKMQDLRLQIKALEENVTKHPFV